MRLSGFVLILFDHFYNLLFFLVSARGGFLQPFASIVCLFPVSGIPLPRRLLASRMRSGSGWEAGWRRLSWNFLPSRARASRVLVGFTGTGPRAWARWLRPRTGAQGLRPPEFIKFGPSGCLQNSGRSHHGGSAFVCFCSRRRSSSWLHHSWCKTAGGGLGGGEIHGEKRIPGLSLDFLECE